MSETTTQIEHCTSADIGITGSGKDWPAFEAALNVYLYRFAKPITEDSEDGLFGNRKCINCGTTINGIMGSFVYGIVNGEGICGNCGWPCRANHYPEHKGKQMFERFPEIVLQYHPDYVSEKGGEK